MDVDGARRFDQVFVQLRERFGNLVRCLVKLLRCLGKDPSEGFLQWSKWVGRQGLRRVQRQSENEEQN